MNWLRAVAVAASVSMMVLRASHAGAQTVDELYAEGVKARLEQRLDEAAGLLARALALQPDNADALVQLGFVELGRGDTKAARRSFTDALAIAPDYADAEYGVALVEFREGNLDRALAIAEPLAARQAENQDVADLLTTLRAALSAKEKEQASPAKPRTRQVTPVKARRDPVASLLAKAMRLRKESSFAEAERVYRKALALSPRNVDILVALGLVSGFQQKFEQSAEFFDAALAIDGENLDARLGTVRLAFWQGDIERARSLIDEARLLAPDNAELRGLDARISLLEGDDARAGEIFTALVSEDSRNVEALVGLGDVFRARGDDEAARAQYNRALEVTPGAREIEERLAAPPIRKWRVDIGSEFSELSQGRGVWTDSAAALSYKMTPDMTATARARAVERYGKTDFQFEGRIDRAFGKSVTAYALAAVTPHADFLALHSFGGGGSLRLLERQEAMGPVFFNLDARFDEFAESRITTLSPWMQAYLIDERLALSARWVRAQDEIGTIADGYVVRGDVTVSERLRVFAGYGDTPEIAEGSLTETTTIFGGLSFDISDMLTINGSFSREERPTLERDTFGFSLSVRY